MAGAGQGASYQHLISQRSRFDHLKASPEVIRLAEMLSVRFALLLKNREDLLQESGIEVRHETVRFWRQRLGPMSAGEIRRKRVWSDREDCHTGCAADPAPSH